MRRPVRRGITGPRRASSNVNTMNMARVQRRQQVPSTVRQQSNATARPRPRPRPRPTNPFSRPVQGRRSGQSLPSTPPTQVQNTLGAAQRQVPQRQQQRRSMGPLNPADNKANALNARMAAQNNAPKTTPQYSKGGVVHKDYRKDGMFKK